MSFRRIIANFALASLLFSGPYFAFAQTASSATLPTSDQSTTEALQKQITELLKQVQSLQQQISALKGELGVPAATQPGAELPSSATTDVAPPNLTRNLSRGDSGEDVRKLQTFLAGDKEVYPEGLVTGYFGPLTEAAVKRWQTKHEIESLGIIGPKTTAKFGEIIEQRSGATPAIPATPAVPGVTPAIPATPAVPPGLSSTTPPTAVPPVIPPPLTGVPPTTTPPTVTAPPTAPTAPAPVTGQAVPAWVRLLGGSQSDQAWGMTRDNANNVYIVGDTYAALDGQVINGMGDAFIAKYDPNGNRLWTRLVGSTVGDVLKAAAVDNSNNLYAVGLTYGSVDGLPNAGNTDALIVKYDSNGNKLWVREFGANLNDQLYGVAVDSSGNVYAAGLTDTGVDGQTSSGLMDALLVKYDSAGTKLWTRLLGSYTYDRSDGSIGVDSSGNVYIAGWTRATLGDQISTGGDDAFIAKYTSAGQRLWIRQWGTADNDDAFALAVNGNNLYAVGQTKGSIDIQPRQGDYDAFVSKFDLNGNRLWSRQLGTAGFDTALAVAADGSGNAYISGYVNGSLDGQTNAGSSDAFVAKYDVDGNKIWTKLLGSAAADESHGVAVDSVGNVYIAGYTYGSLGGQPYSGVSDAFVAKYALGSSTPATATTPTTTTTTTSAPTAPTTATTPTTSTTATTPTTTTTASTTTLTSSTTTYAYPLTGVTVTAISSSKIVLSWPSATGNVIGYRIYRNGPLLTNLATTSTGTLYYSDSGLTPSTSYSYEVVAYDAAGNNVANSLWVSTFTLSLSTTTTTTTTTSPDTTPPVISNIRPTSINQNNATIAWETNEPASSKIRYGTASEIYPGAVSSRLEITTLTTSHSMYLDNLMAGTTYYYTVSSNDASNNSAYGGELTFTTLAASTADVTPPVISNLQVTNITSSGATISWTTDEPSTSGVKYDPNPDMIDFRVREDVSNLTTSHSLTLSNLTAATTYYYFVLSIDASNNTAYLPAIWPQTKTFVTSAASTSSTATCSALTFSTSKTTYVLGESGSVSFSCPSPVYVCMRITNPAGTVTGIGCHTATSGIDAFTISSVGNYIARACYNATGVSDCPTIAASVPFTVVAASSAAPTEPSSLATLLESLASILQQIQQLLK